MASLAKISTSAAKRPSASATSAPYQRARRRRSERGCGRSPVFTARAPTLAPGRRIVTMVGRRLAPRLRAGGHTPPPLPPPSPAGGTGRSTALPESIGESIGSFLEDIADTADGMDEAWLAGGFELGAQVADVDLHHVG